MNTFSQDIQFSQIYQADLLLNPAFAGRDYRNRVMSHSRLQWPNAPAPYTTTFTSFDKFIHKYNTGVGVYALYDRQGPGSIQSYELHSLFSYELHFTETLALRFGLQAGFVHRSLSEDQIYPDQLTDKGIVDVAPRLNGPTSTYPDFGGSFLFFSPKFWFGMNAGHLNSPDFSFLGDQDKLPQRYTAILGYKIDLSEEETAGNYSGFIKDLTIYPLIHYKHQGKLDQVEIGAYGIDDQFLFGLFYRGIPFKKYNAETQNNESIITLIGWRYGSMSITYSYDWILSELTPAVPRGAHELNITYVFPREPKHKTPRVLPCPNFNRNTGLKW